MPPKPRKPPPAKPTGSNRNLLIAAGAAAAVVVVWSSRASCSVAATRQRCRVDRRHGPGLDASRRDPAGPGRPGLAAGEGDDDPVRGSPVPDPPGTTSSEGFPGVVDEYVKPGKVKLRFVGMDFLGPDSRRRSSYTLAAGEQGKLWQFSDALYATRATRIGLGHRLPAPEDRGRPRARLRKAEDVRRRPGDTTAGELDGGGGRRSGRCQGTPTFYVQVGAGGAYQVNPARFATERVRARSSTTRSPAEPAA